MNASNKWTTENPELKRLYSRKYYYKKKGMPLPPEIAARIAEIKKGKKPATNKGFIEYKPEGKSIITVEKGDVKITVSTEEGLRAVLSVIGGL